MKTVKIEKTETTFFIPASDLLAVYNAVSKEVTRHYLNGVFVESRESGLHMTATDGHVLMSVIAPDESSIGNECYLGNEAGMIMRVDVKEKALNAKPTGEAWVYGDVKTGIAQIVDYHSDENEHPRLGVCEFSRINGTFPNWIAIVPKETDPKSCVCVNPDLVNKFSKAAKSYRDSDGCLRINPGNPGDPMRVDISNVPRFTGVLMPVRWRY